MANQTEALELMLALVNEVTTRVHQEKHSLEEALTAAVSRVAKEDLGQLILLADRFAPQFYVKSRIGFPRYTDSWEEYLREMLKGILTVGLNLDRL
jgi:hypothetical protein